VWVGDEVYTTRVGDGVYLSTVDDHVKFNASEKWAELTENEILHVVENDDSFIMLRRCTSESRKRDREETDFLLDDEKKMIEEMNELNMTFVNRCTHQKQFANYMGWILVPNYTIRVLGSVGKVRGCLEHVPEEVQIECKYSHPENNRPCRFKTHVDWDKFPEREQAMIVYALSQRKVEVAKARTMDKFSGQCCGYYLAFQPPSKRSRGL